jgi:hypothetical protein
LSLEKKIVSNYPKNNSSSDEKPEKLFVEKKCIQLSKKTVHHPLKNRNE